MVESELEDLNQRLGRMEQLLESVGDIYYDILKRSNLTPGAIQSHIESQRNKLNEAVQKGADHQTLEEVAQEVEDLEENVVNLIEHILQAEGRTIHEELNDLLSQV